MGAARLNEAAEEEAMTDRVSCILASTHARPHEKTGSTTSGARQGEWEPCLPSPPPLVFSSPLARSIRSRPRLDPGRSSFSSLVSIPSHSHIIGSSCVCPFSFSFLSLFCFHQSWSLPYCPSTIIIALNQKHQLQFNLLSSSLVDIILI